MFELERDEGGSGDPGDGRGPRLTLAQGLESNLQQGVGTFGDSVDASDHGVERLLGLGEFTAFGLLDRVAEAGPGVLVAEAGRGRGAQGGGEPVQGVDKSAGSCAGGVVLTDRGDMGQPSGAAMTCTFPPWCLCLPDHHRSAPLGPAAATRSVRITVPSRLRWVDPAAAALSSAVEQIGRVVGQYGQPLMQTAIGGQYATWSLWLYGT